MKLGYSDIQVTQINGKKVVFFLSENSPVVTSSIVDVEIEQENTVSWIKVEDEIPEFMKRILFCDEDGWIYIGRFEEGIGFLSGTGDDIGCKVTHWAHMPISPK